MFSIFSCYKNTLLYLQYLRPFISNSFSPLKVFDNHACPQARGVGVGGVKFRIQTTIIGKESEREKGTERTPIDYSVLLL